MTNEGMVFMLDFNCFYFSFTLIFMIIFINLIIIKEGVLDTKCFEYFEFISQLFCTFRRPFT